MLVGSSFYGETGRFRWRGADEVDPCPIFILSVNTVSLAIGLPVSRTVAYPRRSDSVGSPWSTAFVRNPDFIIVGYEREISRMTFRYPYANQ